MKKIASIDIGSNSILLLIGEVDKENILVLENEANVTGLGRDLDKNGEFLLESMNDSFKVLSSYVDLCIKHHINPCDVVVTATEATRVANNAPDFIAKVNNELGLNITVLTGEGEAYYSTAGILFDSQIQDEQISIMDIGGASTELIKVDTKTKKILHSFSMPIGAVRWNNWKSSGVLDEKLSEIFDNYSESLEKFHTSKLYCVAGTMTSVGSIYLGHKNFKEKDVNGLEFKIESLKDLHERHMDKTVEEMLTIYPFLGKRSQTIHAGIELAMAIMEKVGNNQIYISTYGLRYGTLLLGEIKGEFIINR